MNYHVKVDLVNGETIEDEFYHVHINEEAEWIMLFKDVTKKDSFDNRVMRYSIPMCNVVSISIEPIEHENHEQKISSC